MRNVGTIYGRRELVNAMQKAISSRQTAHAYLFYGPEGIERKPLPGFCRCPELYSCRNKTMRRLFLLPEGIAKTHPDIIWLAPNGKTIKLEQIRNLKRQAYLQPQEGRLQVLFWKRPIP